VIDVRVVWRADADGVWGTAYGPDGMPLTMVMASFGYFGARSLDELIDKHLSPMLDAKLAAIVGPLASKSVTRL